MSYRLDRHWRLKGPSSKLASPRVARLRVEPLEERALLATLPAGFTETTVVTGLSGATAMEFSPDGRLWAIEQTGKVKLVRNDGSTFTALTKSVDSNGERGLLGIAFDPNFASNKFVYLYYTNAAAGAAPWATGVHNQLSRFTVNDANPQQPSLTAEAPILDMNTLSGATNHNAGAIHFGADGKLYVNTGDNTQTFVGPNGNTYRVSQTLNNLLGKQLRIDVAKFNTGAAARNSTAVGGLIPTDNPFVGTATGINQLIYVLGLRNPFTFAVQPGTGKMIVNDVGETQWEELNLVTAGANFGWAGGNSDGFGHPQPSFAPGVYKDPSLAYAHSGSGSKATGAAVVGSTFYNPPTVQFPASYVGMYFYQDLASGWIRYFNPNAPNAAGSPDGNSQPFATNTPGALRDLKVDTVGNLLYLAGGDGSIRKISYQAPAIATQPANQTVAPGQMATFTVVASGPGLQYQWQRQTGASWTNTGTNTATLSIANAQAANAGAYRVVVSNTYGSITSNAATLSINAAGTAPGITSQPTSVQANVGQAASFSILASGATPLTYQWQRLVGATWTNVGTNSTTHTIAAVATGDGGSYRAIVSNSLGSVTSATVTLTVNQLPTITISSPVAMSKFNWDQTINFAGSASDLEDGVLAASKLNWEVLFFHQTLPDGTGLHSHPFRNFSGVASGAIETDFNETSPYIWYRFTLTATDSKGATASKFVDIQPNLGSFTLQSNPGGLQLLLDGGPVAAGTTISSTWGQPRTVSVNSPQAMGSMSYAFASWSDGGAMSHTINTAATNVTYTANFTPTGPASPLLASYSAAPPTNVTPAQMVTYPISVINTGTQTWSATGANAVTLGVYFDGTSDAVGAWATEPRRFLLPQNVAPGSSAIVNVSLPAPAANGTYTLRNRLVQEGIAWFNDIHKTTVVVGAAQALNASYVAAPPTSVTPGQTVSYPITITNTGSQTWSSTGANLVALGVYFDGTSDAVGAWATEPRRFLLPGNVAPGASVTLNITLPAPAANGTYTLRNRMVQEGIAWFTSIHKTTVAVASAVPLSASYASSPPATVSPGQMVSYPITLTNTGSQTWGTTGANFVDLGVYFDGTSDAVGAWASEPWRFLLPANVAPGASVTLNVSLPAPTASGNYTLRNRMVQEGVAWFAAMQKVPVVVGTPTTLSAVYSSLPPTTWTAGQTVTYTVSVLNTGTQTWNPGGANPVYLGVYYNGTSDAIGAWPSEPLRVVLPNDVAPGATANISVTFTAPAPGTYVLRHRLVKEQVAWFSSLQSISVTVR